MEEFEKSRLDKLHSATGCFKKIVQDHQQRKADLEIAEASESSEWLGILAVLDKIKQEKQAVEAERQRLEEIEKSRLKKVHSAMASIS